MTRERQVLLAHVAATLALVGLIWTVQLVHYPAFHDVGARQFVAFHAGHSQHITWIVGPLMLVELGTALLLLTHGPRALPFPVALAGLLLILLIWGSTLFLFMPLHNRLAGGYDQETVTILVWANWVRTIAWSVRGGGVLWLLGRMLGR